MLLLEHDAKELAAEHGIPVPRGVFVLAQDELSEERVGPGPWMVKAQAAVGGRGKAGAIRSADTLTEVAEVVRALRDFRIKGHEILGFRIEQRIAFTREAYLSFSVDPAQRGIRLLLSDAGGVDIEETANRTGALLTAVAGADIQSLTSTALTLAARLPETVRAAVTAAIPPLARLFLDCEATLLEVNPLFVLEDGSWVAGDFKLALDENALPRESRLERIVRDRSDAYREPAFKLAHGFDYVELDPNGEIGLLTTGAGLSMMLVDQMLRAGRRPFNFCDVRSGLLRGSPERLVEVLRRFAKGSALAVVLVNIFAGITDLEEFARLLLMALDAVPELRVPVVARLIGNNFAAAERLIVQSGRPVVVEMDLDRALALTVERAGATA
jgi:succinyl-CoA synthetase beta subunit